jgi:hypothetical protein
VIGDERRQVPPHPAAPQHRCGECKVNDARLDYDKAGLCGSEGDGDGGARNDVPH